MSSHHNMIKVTVAFAASMLMLATWWLPIPPAAGGPLPPPAYSQYDAAASSAHPSIGLGTSSAMFGSTLVVGGHNAQGRMTAYVFTKPALGWTDVTPIAVLTTSGPTDDLADSPSVAISGSAIVVGVDSATVAGHQGAGNVEIFARGAAGWVSTSHPTKTLTAPDPATSSLFGQDVALDGNSIVVGSLAVNSPSGAAYVFAKPSGDSWTRTREAAELTASNAASGADLTTVAASGTTIVLTGRTPNIYVFTEPGTGWADAHETGELETDASNSSAGSSVAIDRGTIAFGIWTAAVSVQNQGAAYVFVPPTRAGWVPAAFPQGAAAVLTAPDPQNGDSLGRSVAVSGGKVIVGADGRAVDGMGARGAVFVWDSHGDGWDATPTPHELTTTTGHLSDSFGASVAATSRFIAAGAPQAENPASTDPSPGTGVDYVFAPPRTRLRSVSQSPAAWRAGSRATRPNPTATPHGGTTYSLRLDVAATVTFDFAKQLPGRASRGRCVAPTSANRSHAHCRRYTRGLPIKFALPAGRNKVWFDGWFSGGSQLKPGKYRVVLTAKANGSTSLPKTLRFKVRRP